MKQYKPKELQKFFERKGWYVIRQTGSHRIMTHDDLNIAVPILIHNKDIPTGTLLAILRQTGYNKEELEQTWQSMIDS